VGNYDKKRICRAWAPIATMADYGRLGVSSIHSAKPTRSGPFSESEVLDIREHVGFGKEPLEKNQKTWCLACRLLHRSYLPRVPQ